MDRWIKFVSAIVLCLIAGFIGSLFTAPMIPTWYTTIEKPFFNPPDWLFGPVWASLYIIMGISLFLVWDSKAEKKSIRNASYIFLIQLFLNSIWSVIFFGLKDIFLAFLEIIILWAFIMLTISKFYKISKNAGIMLIPYIIWISFAAVLNFYVWILN